MGVSCSCETKDDQRENKTNNYSPLAVSQPRQVGYNPHLNKNEYQIMNKTTFDQTKKDASLQCRVLVSLFGRITDSKCKEIVPALINNVSQKYPNQICTLMIDCDNSPEILKEDIVEHDKEFPWVKVYSDVNYIGVVYEKDEIGLDNFIQEGIIKLSKTNNDNDKPNQVNEKINNNDVEIQAQAVNNNQENIVLEDNNQQNEKNNDVNIYQFENFFKSNQIHLKTSDDLKAVIEKSLAEQKVLFVNFSKEDEICQKIAASFEQASDKYSADVITAVCNVVLYEEVVQAVLEGGTSNISFPFIRTYVNGKMWEDCFGESKNLDIMLDYAVAAIVKNNNNNNNNNNNEAFDYGQQIEFTFTTISTEELFNTALETAESENKTLIIYFYRPGENDEIGSKFDTVGSQFTGTQCCFAKADVNVATFILNKIPEGPFPVVQAYVKKMKINETRGSNDDLKSFIENALSQVV